jgi:hypothetical protein
MTVMGREGYVCALALAPAPQSDAIATARISHLILHPPTALAMIPPWPSRAVS